MKSGGPSHHRRSAFSLIEIVLALAVIAFALVGIMGLFPVALDSAVSSQRETQIALIARSIFADLGAGLGTKTFLTTDVENAKSGLDVDLSQAKTYYLGYNSDGKVLGEASSSDYQSGSSRLAFVAKVVVEPIPPADGYARMIPDTGLSQVTVSVEAPAGAPADKRRRYPFASILGQDVRQDKRMPKEGTK